MALAGCNAVHMLPALPALDPVAWSGAPESCVLRSWEDGDTPYVQCGSGTAEAVRLLDIDAPESGFDDNSRRRAEWQAKLWKLRVEAVLACGRAATAAAKEICPEGSPVEVLGDDRDKYGRRLAYVRCRGQSLNLRMIEEGHAGRYPYPADPDRPRGCK